MQVFLVYLRAMCFVASFLILGALVVSRSYIFYESYVHLTVERAEEAWLRVRCNEAEFYTNMRQHTDLCSKVEHNARSSILFRSLNTMATSTNLCSNSRTCMEYIHEIVVKGLAWPLAAVVCVMLITIPSLVVSVARKAIWRKFDEKARNTPATIGGIPGGGTYFSDLQNRKWHRMCDVHEENDDHSEKDDKRRYQITTSPFYEDDSNDYNNPNKAVQVGVIMNAKKYIYGTNGACMEEEEEEDACGFEEKSLEMSESMNKRRNTYCFRSM